MPESPPPLRAPGRFSRRRAACLIAVHVAIGLHFAHWRIAGRTLAPLELNEVMHTLELGLVTAGFLLMATAVVSTALFGRFFCSWGCHLLALQDLSAWILGKLRIHPAPVRSRLLRLLPAGAAFYMFLWPQIARVVVRRWPEAASWLGPRPPFELRIHSDNEGWASFLTSELTRNLPGVGIALLTFLVCGFLLVWLLGSRSFCRDVCPYGAVFSLADRLAPRRIVLAGDCTACGRCTAVCDSGVSVYEQVTRWGAVRSGDCLKDLDCVAVCPTGGLTYGRARRPLFARRELERRVERSWGEEWIGAAAFVATLVSYRGLYREVPFLLSLALGILAASAAVVALRLARRPEVRWQRWSLKRSGRWTGTGLAAGTAIALFAALTMHSAAIRAHELRGDRAWAAWTRTSAVAGSSTEPSPRLLESLEARHRWGLVRPADLAVRRSAVHLARAARLAETSRPYEALAELDAAVAADPALAVPHYNAGVLLAALGREDDALRAFRAAIRLDPQDAESWNNLGFLLWTRDELAEAESGLRTAMALEPGYAQPCVNLAEMLAITGRAAEAERIASECPRAAP